MTKKQPKIVSIDASVLGINKPIAVIQSNRTQVEAMKMQLAMAKLQDGDNEEDYMKMLEVYSEVVDKEVAFLTKVLKLTPTQADAVLDLDQQETIDLIMQVITRVMGMEQTEDEEEVIK